MRRTTLFLLVLLALPLSATGSHQATPVDVLLKKLGLTVRSHADHHHGHATEAPNVVVPPDMIVVDAPMSALSTAAPRTFNITAKRFEYVTDPSPFVVNVGDVVTVNITSSDVVHGWFLERYDQTSRTIRNGQTTTFTFTANQAGTFTFTCTISCGSGHGSMSGVFTVTQAAVAPTISSFTPTSGPTSGGTAVTVAGTGFVSGAVVKFGSVNATSVTFNSSTSITAVSPAAAAGGVTITVTNPDGLSATSTASFNYVGIVPPPAINGFTPNNGPATGGTAVTIAGGNFQNGAVVKFGELFAGNVIFNSATSLTAISPSRNGGSVKITVTNPDGQSMTSTTDFTYAAPITPPPRRRAGRH